MEDDEKRESKYPPPHPVFLREHQATVDLVRDLKARVKELEERLFLMSTSADRMRRAVNGGGTDPWSDPQHPGHILILLGWEHHADVDGLNWKDPQKENGKTLHRTLPEALGLACRRLMDRRHYPSFAEQLDEDRDDD